MQRSFFKFGVRFSVAALAALPVLLVAVTGAPAAHAQTTALTINGGGTSITASQVRGWRFTIAAPLTVTSLGYYDDPQNNGLARNHTVGIFTTGGTLLVSTTVSAGTVNPLTNVFRFNSSLTETSVGSATLAAGTYDIVGTSSVDALLTALSSAQAPTSADVTYVASVSRSDNTFAAPTNTNAGVDRAYFGPNFQYTTTAAAAPEPGSIALLLTGAPALVGGVIARRRKNKSA